MAHCSTPVPVQPEPHPARLPSSQSRLRLLLRLVRRPLLLPEPALGLQGIDRLLERCDLASGDLVRLPQRPLKVLDRALLISQLLQGDARGQGGDWLLVSC